jgi:hypothetical protein
MPTTNPTEYLRQYLADETILSRHPLRMHGGRVACAVWSHIITAVGLAVHGEAAKREKN